MANFFIWHWQHLRREELEDVWAGECGHELHVLINPNGHRANPNSRKANCPSCEDIKTGRKVDE